MKIYLLTFLLALFAISTHGAVILKTKNKKALIHLEGLKTKQGAYFEVLDLYGKPRGLVRISKVGDKKAIGFLQAGHMEYKWSLEPKSKGFAYSKLNGKNKKIAFAKKKTRKKRASRGLANYQEGEQYLVDENQLIQENYGSESYYTADSYPSSSVPSLVVGIKPEGSFNFLALHPEDQNLTGLGFGSSLFVEASLNPLLSAEVHVGYKHFAASNEAECGGFLPCSLTMDYIVGGLNLKATFLQKKSVRIFAGVDGSLLYPFRYSNKANLTRESFGLHGTLGTLLGADLSFGDVVLPLVVNVNLMVPPTSTTLILTSGIQIGLGYRF